MCGLLAIRMFCHPGWENLRTNVQNKFARRKGSDRLRNRKGRTSRYSLDWLYWFGTGLMAIIILWIITMIVLEALSNGFR